MTAQWSCPSCGKSGAFQYEPDYNQYLMNSIAALEHDKASPESVCKRTFPEVKK